MSGDHVRGVAVHTAARIEAQAGAGEVLVSSTTRDLAEGATDAEGRSNRERLIRTLPGDHER